MTAKSEVVDIAQALGAGAREKAELAMIDLADKSASENLGLRFLLREFVEGGEYEVFSIVRSMVVDK